MGASDTFDGVIGRTVAESTPSWPAPPRPRAGAPNVVVILIDDLGFSHFGCFGSSIETPADRPLAANGLRYTNFHVTPLCSPTRASLLTGRNHHEVGMRSIANFNTGFPNMRGEISPRGRDDGRGAPRRGLRDVRRRQVAPVPDGAGLGRRPLRPVALPARVRPLLRLPRRRDGPVLPRPRRRQPPRRAADAARGRLPPERGPRRPRDRDGARRDVDSAGPPVLPVPRLRRDARAAPGAARRTWTSTAAASTTGWDVARDEWFARQRELGVHPRGHPARAAQPGRRALGGHARGAPPAGGAPPGGVRRVPRAHRRADRPARRRARAHRAARQHAPRPRSRTTARARRAARSACCTR